MNVDQNFISQVTLVSQTTPKIPYPLVTNNLILRREVHNSPCLLWSNQSHMEQPAAFMITYCTLTEHPFIGPCGTAK